MKRQNESRKSHKGIVVALLLLLLFSMAFAAHKVELGKEEEKFLTPAAVVEGAAQTAAPQEPSPAEEPAVLAEKPARQPAVEKTFQKVQPSVTGASSQEETAVQGMAASEPGVTDETTAALEELLSALLASTLPSMPELSIEDIEVPLGDAAAVLTPETLEAIAVLETVEQAQQHASSSSSSAKRAQAAREQAKETLSQAVESEKAAKETLEQAQELARQAQADLLAAQEKSDGTAQELADAKKALESAKATADSAQELAKAKAGELESAKAAAKEAADKAEQLSKAANEAQATADELKSSTKVYEAIAVLEKGITESGINEKAQELKKKDYFESMSSLNSTGSNYAPLMNEYLEADGVLDQKDAYTYRIYKCNGTNGEGYNIFFVLEGVDDKALGDAVLKVVRYNTKAGTYLVGDTVVTKDVEKNKVLDGASFNQNAVDITEQAKTALNELSQAESEATKAQEAAQTAQADKLHADKLEQEKQEQADDAAQSSEQAQAALDGAREAAGEAEQADETAKAELAEAKQEQTDAAEQEKAAQDTLDHATESVTQAASEADKVGVPEQEIEEILSAGSETGADAQQSSDVQE